MNIYDIIIAGSATIDVFVKTHVSRIRADKKHEELIGYPLGEKILVEELHQEVGGGGTNTAVAFSRMGFKTGYFGALSKDNNSKLIISALKKDKIDFLGVFKNGITNYSVILDSQLNDRTILAYKGVSESLKKSDIKIFNARWLYMSSLDFDIMEKLVFVAKKISANVAFNPSSYLVKFGIKKLRKILRNVDILIFNKEEARLLLKSKEDIIHLLNKLSAYVKIVVVTDGKKGVWVINNKIIYSAIPKKNLKIIETTGAGDAFASGFVSGMMLKKSLDDCLKLGLLNSESVITHLGAKNVLLSRNHALRMLKKDKRKVHKIILK